MSRPAMAAVAVAVVASALAVLGAAPARRAAQAPQNATIVVYKSPT